MKHKTIIAIWIVFSISIIVFHTKSVRDHIPLSNCHLAEITWYYDKPMCTECKLFCEVME